MKWAQARVQGQRWPVHTLVRGRQVGGRLWFGSTKPEPNRVETQQAAHLECRWCIGLPCGTSAVVLVSVRLPTIELVLQPLRPCGLTTPRFFFVSCRCCLVVALACGFSRRGHANSVSFSSHGPLSACWLLVSGWFASRFCAGCCV